METGFVRVAISKLKKADWNYKHDDAQLMAKLVENIKKNGELENIVIRELSTGEFEVVNGNHRLEAYQTLGMKDAICHNLGKISDAKARRIAITLNETKFTHDVVKLSGLIKEISVEVPVVDMEKTMPYSGDEIQNMMDSLAFNWQENKKPSAKSSGEFRTLKVTKEQWDILLQAVERVRESEKDPAMSEGRCLELICGDYLAGAGVAS